MSGSELVQLGANGILAFAFLILAYIGQPLIQALVIAMREGTEARKAVLTRWAESDAVLDKNANALNSITMHINKLGDSVRHLNNTQMLQGEVNKTALQESVSAIRGDLIIVKDDAVNALTNTINTSFTVQGATMSKILESDEKTLTEQKQTREHLERLGAKMDAVEAKMDAVLERLNQITPPTPTVQTTEAAQAPVIDPPKVDGDTEPIP